MKKPTNLWGFFLANFNYKTGENWDFWPKSTHQVGSPPNVYIYIYIYACCRVSNWTNFFWCSLTKPAKTWCEMKKRPWKGLQKLRAFWRLNLAHFKRNRFSGFFGVRSPRRPGDFQEEHGVWKCALPADNGFSCSLRWSPFCLFFGVRENHKKREQKRQSEEDEEEEEEAKDKEEEEEKKRRRRRRRQRRKLRKVNK